MDITHNVAWLESRHWQPISNTVQRATVNLSYIRGMDVHMLKHVCYRARRRGLGGEVRHVIRPDADLQRHMGGVQGASPLVVPAVVAQSHEGAWRDPR
jgi:hypothetical protein